MYACVPHTHLGPKIHSGYLPQLSLASLLYILRKALNVRFILFFSFFIFCFFSVQQSWLTWNPLCRSG